MEDVRARFEDSEEALAASHDGRQADLWTAVPIIFESYDPKTGTASVQPAIKSIVRKSDGTSEAVNLPLIQDAPVHFPGGGGATMTFPIKKGDEGMAIISSRSLDGWHQSGEVQKQTDARMHDLSDAMIIPGMRSKPRALKNVSADSVQLRSDDGKHFVDLHPEKGLSMNSWGHSVAFTEEGIDLKSTKLTHNGRNISGNHKHGGIMPGGAMTDIPDEA